MADLVRDLETKLTEFTETVTEQLKAQKENSENAVKDSKKLTDEKIVEMIKDVEKKNTDLLEAVKRNNVSLDVPGNEKKNFNLGRYIKGGLLDNWDGAGFEKECYDATKDQDTNSGGAGGFLIATDFGIDKIIKPAQEAMVMSKLGVTQWNGLTGDLEIPKELNEPVLTWGSDGDEAALQNLTFGLTRMSPRHGSMIVKVSNNLWHQSAGVINDLVSEKMIRGSRLGMDKVAINGINSDSQPLGILNAPGTNTYDVSNARMDTVDVAAMREDIEESNYLQEGGAGFLCRPKVVGGFRRERIAQFSGQTLGMPIINPLMDMTQLEALTGTKFGMTTSVLKPADLTKAVIGQWDQFVIATWGGIRVKRSVEAGDSFAKDQTWFAIFVDIDTLVKQALAFNIASNISTDF